ncbi:hypothetical protein BC939DRAFT_458041 [Gamsiella multidivaricata]|uniref:uncharacterized protein n=1 Tax=Gamsiella multidivaricata TaxID=101098 RepID=UPI00221E6D6D|nr:uncharacterized protein BC939DRAFT_458041 [Gamsiella multidivaricata]KAI7820460.1 hypothetical protein BC939DRAFT_458041 [Gamsiella multidivaricata]
MDPIATDQLDNNTLGTGNQAVFIAKVLAITAASILLLAVICCIYSGAARRQARLEHAALQGRSSVGNENEAHEAGRRTPDAAPAYSTTSPLGPLSPEIVNAISSASVERRQSIVTSILSSSRSQRYRLDTSSMDLRVGTAQSSMISSIEEVPPIHSLGTSPRSSLNSDWPYEDIAGQGRVRGIDEPLWVTRESHDIEADSIAHMHQAPPSYDPSWWTAWHAHHHHTIQNRYRPPLGQEAGQPLSRSQQLVLTASHRRTESLSSPLGGNPLQLSLAYRRGLLRRAAWPASGRSLSWTGEPIAHSYTPTRMSFHTSSDNSNQLEAVSSHSVEDS